MEGPHRFNTFECLRGRLLAERQASRVAKEEAQSMANKFVELEKKLKEEIKLRDRAERKLKVLKKKLECFNVSSHWGEKCENSCVSSLCSTSSRETKLRRVNPALLENEIHKHNVAEEYVLVQTHNSPFTTKDCGTSSCNSEPQILGKNPNQSLDNLKNAI